MLRRSITNLVPLAEPQSHALITRFGGHPTWVSERQWPLSGELGVPMLFIGQFVLDDAMFPSADGKVAYLFMTADEKCVDTFDPYGGENAIVIQPNGKLTADVSPLATCPALSCLAPEVSEDHDPDFIPSAQLWEMGEDKKSAYRKQLEGDKLGGTPRFIQNDEFPEGPTPDAGADKWRLLLQLRGDRLGLNFGDAGVGYAFINEDASEGRFLWQCS